LNIIQVKISFLQYVVLVLPPQLQTRALTDVVPQVYVLKNELRIDVATGYGVLETVLFEVLLDGLLVEGVAAFQNYRIPHDLLN